MVSAVSTSQAAHSGGARQFVLSDGSTLRAVKPGEALRIKAVAGRRYRLIQQGPNGQEALEKALAIAEGGAEDGNLRLLLDDGSEIIIEDFYTVPDTAVDIPDLSGKAETITHQTRPLASGADGADLVLASGNREALTELAADFAGRFDVLSPAKIANVLTWTTSSEAAAISSSTFIESNVFSTASLGSTFGILAGVAATAVGVATVGSSSSDGGDGGSDDDDTTVDPNAPVIGVEPIATDNKVNQAEKESEDGVEITGTTTNVEDGQVLTVNWGGVIKTTKVDDGEWSITFDPDEIPEDGNHTITVSVTNKEGLSTSIDSVLPVDTVANVSFNTVAGDGKLNAAELASGVTITGTTDVEDGRTITVMLGSVSKEVTASSGAWSATFSSSEMPSGSSATLVVTTADAAGNDALSMTTILIDTSVSLTLTTMSAGDSMNASEVTSSFTFGGTTTIESGREISVTWNGVTRTATSNGSTWLVTFEVADIPATDGVYTLTVTGTDLAGNPATVTRDITVDRVAPTISIDTVATDGIVTAAEKTAGYTITGTTTGVEDGQEVTVTFGGKEVTATVTGNSWSASFTADDTPSDGVSVAVSAAVEDAAGNAATDATATAIIDTSPPALTIAVVAGDDIVSAIEKGADVTISGTASDMADGAEVTVEWGGTQKTAIVSAGAWSVVYASGELPADGDTTVTADAVDDHGNAAVQATRIVNVGGTLTLGAIGSLISGFIIEGASADDQSGFAVSWLGDVNGDGLADLIIGAHLADAGGNNEAGRTYVLFGSTDGTIATMSFDVSYGDTDDSIFDSIAVQSIAAGAGDDTITIADANIVYAGAGNDVVRIADSSIFADLGSYFGENGNIDQLSRIDGGTGIDTIELYGSGFAIDLSAISDIGAAAPSGMGRISSIEIFDIGGTGSNSLTLGVEDVLLIAGQNVFNDLVGGTGFGDEVNAHQLLIDGDLDDTFTLSDSVDWTSQGSVTWNGNSFQAFAHSSLDAVVYISTNLLPG